MFLAIILRRNGFRVYFCPLFEPHTGKTVQYIVMAPREKKSDNVTKAELVDRISEETGLTKLEVKTVVEGFINGILSSMSERRRIEIRGFGVFSVKSRKPRMARNPRTGDSVELKARYAPVFKASNDFIAEVDAKIKSRTEKNS